VADDWVRKFGDAPDYLPVLHGLDELTNGHLEDLARKARSGDRSKDHLYLDKASWKEFEAIAYAQGMTAEEYASEILIGDLQFIRDWRAGRLEDFGAEFTPGLSPEDLARYPWWPIWADKPGTTTPNGAITRYLEAWLLKRLRDLARLGPQEVPDASRDWREWRRGRSRDALKARRPDLRTPPVVAFEESSFPSPDSRVKAAEDELLFREEYDPAILDAVERLAARSEDPDHRAWLLDLLDATKRGLKKPYDYDDEKLLISVADRVSGVLRGYLLGWWADPNRGPWARSEEGWKAYRAALYKNLRRAQEGGRFPITEEEWKAIRDLVEMRFREADGLEVESRRKKRKRRSKGR
jgi:hypothetical protein